MEGGMRMMQNKQMIVADAREMGEKRALNIYFV